MGKYLNFVILLSIVIVRERKKMKSKIMSILVVMLFIASAVITAIGDTDENESHLIII